MMSDKANGCARLRDCQFSKMTKRGEAYKELGSSWANNLARPNFLFMCRLDCEDSINPKWTSFRIIGREWWGGGQISVVTVVKWQWIRASQVKAFPFLCHASCPSLFSLEGRRCVKTCDASLLLIVGHLFLRSNVAPFRMWWCVDHLFLPRHHSSQSIRY